MKKVIVLLILIIAGAALYFYFKKGKSGPKAPKQEAIMLKKHTNAFNASIDKVVTDYLALKDALVEDDTATAKASARNLMAALDSVHLDELKKDTALIFETAQGNMMDIKANVQSLLAQPNITEMRKDFSAVTDMMYPSFFTSINYEGEKLYLQNCPMAFGDDAPANWLSDKTEIVNPYLGKKHPTYKATMLHCGEVKDSIYAKK